MLPDSKKIKLGSSNQEASPSAGKITGAVLVPCLQMEVHPYSYFFWWSLGVICYDRWESQKLIAELTAELSIFNLFKFTEL